MTIVGGTLTNFAFNVGRRHPLRPGPLIDWDLILVMEPSTILGALAGGYINHVRGMWIPCHGRAVCSLHASSDHIISSKLTQNLALKLHCWPHVLRARVSQSHLHHGRSLIPWA